MKVTISIPKPASQLLHIDVIYENILPGDVNLNLPAWRPGRYEMQNYTSKILRVTVSDTDHKALSCRVSKASRNRWVIKDVQSSRIRVSYIYHADTMDAGGSWLDNEQLYINFINCILYREIDLENGVDVALQVPATYRVATSLKKLPNGMLRADNVHQLLDSPLIASDTLIELTYSIGKSQFHIWFQGPDKLEQDKIIDNFKAFSQAQINLFGDFPCQAYHFLIQSRKVKAYHGVEHSESTVIALGPDHNFSSSSSYTDLMGISSHELFHTWNVKRIRPRALTPYNYAQEAYFDTGYIAEGVTTYYGDLILARAGVFDKQAYLAEINKYLKRHYLNRGRLERSLTESSKDLWVDGYGKSTPGRKVSIYIKGALIALIADLELRMQPGHFVNLDAVMQTMWMKYGDGKIGYISQDYQDEIEALSETSWQAYFDDYVTGVKDLTPKLKEVLAYVGLTMTIKYPDKALAKYFGIRLIENKIVDVDPSSDAFNKVIIGDRIIELDGKEYSKEYKITDGTNLKLRINRFGTENQVELRKGQKSYYPYFEVQESIPISRDQKEQYESWVLGLSSTHPH